MKLLFVAFFLLTAAAHAAEPCRANELKLTFGGRDGEFTGMSHDGAWIIVQNTGNRTCSVPKRPALTLHDAAGKPLAIRRDVPRGMHPGPVEVPVVLKPHAEAKGRMQWVMGEVYDKNICADAATAAFNAPGGTVSAPIHAHMCGQGGDGIEFDQEWLQPSRRQQ